MRISALIYFQLELYVCRVDRFRNMAIVFRQSFLVWQNDTTISTGKRFKLYYTNLKETRIISAENERKRDHYHRYMCIICVDILLIVKF